MSVSEPSASVVIASDKETLDFYGREAEAYAARSDQRPAAESVSRLTKLLQPGARVLELGCGAGRDTAAMRRSGFDVTPIDGSPAMAAQAEERLGAPVRVMRFEDIEWTEEFDGVLAHASLLHVPRKAMPSVLRRVHHALVPGGYLFASFKAGNGEGRDGLGRYYNYPDEALLREWLAAAGTWIGIDIERGMGGGYDGKPTPLLNCLVRKGKAG